ncbi:MAG: FAD-binding oxidoreductase [Pseudomonadota bacterium]
MAPRPDILIVGAGIFGLSAAWALARAGLRVGVLDAAAGPGSGASGGLLGALTPFAPDRWDAKKTFQFRALTAAPGWWAEIAEASGLDPGYARTGRLIPLADGRARALAEARAADAEANWGSIARWRVTDTVPADWLAPEAAPAGAVYETLSARLDPPRALAALARAAARAGATLEWGATVHAACAGRIETATGPREAGTVIVAAGTGTAALLPKPLATSAVKGQAARLAAATPARPLLTPPGLYIVPQADGTVAVGSTKEPGRTDTETDAALEALIDAARRTSPALARAPVTARWAGLRPRGRWPDPILGGFPELPGLLVATGGYGIGFGLAPAVAATLTDLVQGRDPGLPPRFAPAAHLAGDGPHRSTGTPTRLPHSVQDPS